MTSELRIIIDLKTGNLRSLQLVASDACSQSEGFKAYQALAEEINHFAQQASKLIRLQRAIGKL
jgi:hypothetical protein